VVPPARAILSRTDRQFAADLEMILSDIIYGLLARFANGSIDATEILPSLDRAVYWITAGQSTIQTGAGQSRRRSRALAPTAVGRP
jgi:TetR/AcrR family transcriptional regulator, cholesterol catabolism regulator